MSLRDTNIDKLNNSNYNSWKFKVEMLLIKEDLHNTITGEPPTPITEQWTNKDRKARAIINLLIEDNQIIHVKNLTTARDTWNALRNIHERSNLSSKLFLLRKLYSLKLNEHGNMNEHITKIYEIKDKLTAIGETINDQHLSALLLCSLPSSYDTLITALEARPEIELTPDFIRSKLIDEYNKRIENTNNYAGEAAYKAKNKFDRTKNNSKKYCSYCHKTSHYRSDCWFLKNKNQNPSGSSNSYHGKHKQKPKQNMVFQAAKDSENGKYQELKNIESKLNNISFLIGNNSDNAFIIDSGSSSHICNKLELFEIMNDNAKTTVTIANGKTLQCHGTGNVKLEAKISDGENKIITLKDVLFVPDIETNLISVKKATENGCVAIFKDNTCKINYKGATYLEGQITNNLYEAKVNPISRETIHMVNSCQNENCIEIWHRRLGHKNNIQIKQLISNNMATGIKLDKCVHKDECENCIKSKLCDNPYPKQAQFRASKPLQLVHSDLCGPMQTPTLGGKYYLLTFVDDYSRYTVIYLLKNKNETLTKFKEYLNLTQNKFQRKVQILRSDQGGEYTGINFKNFLSEQGIEHQMSVAYCHPQNGVAERKNRTLTEMTRCLLNEAKLSNSFWGEAISTAAYLQNRLPTSSCKKTPYEMWNGRKPDLSNIRIFGSKAFAYVPKHNRKKLDDRAIEGIFLGYDNQSKGYRIYTKDKKIIISRTVKFIENKNSIPEKTETLNHTEEKSNPPISQQPLSIVEQETNDVENIQNETSGSQDNDVNLPRRSNRHNKGVPPDRLIYLTNENRIIEPRSWEEINDIENPTEKRNWIIATKEEIDSLHENKTWDLVDAPPGKKVIGCKWAFKAKYNTNGEIQKYKARLVAKGFAQKFGVDYEETFAPVASHTTIRAFLNMAIYKNLDLRHVDIKTAFLHGNLEEEVYMKQPPGYEKPGQESKVCRLKKAIYGLKQSARAWNKKITESLNKLGFQQSLVDKCLYKRVINDTTTFIIVYVDDMIIAGDENDANEIIEKLSSEFKLTDLGELSYYLGINNKRPERGTLLLDQKNKIQELIDRFNLADAKPSYIPMNPGYVKSNDEENLLNDNSSYRQAVGSLLYISQITRPDINVSVNILSRRNENPRHRDWEAVKQVIKYLKTTIDNKLIIDNKTPPILTAYADADFASDLADRKSTSGNVFMLGKNVIYWCSKKQKTVSVSSAEAEYISAATAALEMKWLINLLNELELPQQLPITLYEDNQSAIKLSENEKNYTRTKHIDTKFHLIRNMINDKILKLMYIPSQKMTADVFTKPLPKASFLTI